MTSTPPPSLALVSAYGSLILILKGKDIRQEIFCVCVQKNSPIRELGVVMSQGQLQGEKGLREREESSKGERKKHVEES